MLTLHINAYGLLLSTAALISLYLVNKRAPLFEIRQNHLDNIFLISVTTSVVGGRLYHVVDKWAYYSQNPIQIFQIWQGGMGIFGALLLSAVSVLIYCRVTNLDPRIVLDLASPAIALSQAIGRFGNFFNKEGFGFPTNLPWGIYIPTESRPEVFKNFSYFHPTFFYESVLCFLLFLILIRVTPQTMNKKGYIFGLYLVGYGFIRLITESYRIDTARILGFKFAYLLSFGLILIGLRLIRAKKVNF